MVDRRRRLDLTGRTVLLTGAASGIGAALARACARAGANVILIDMNTEPLEALCAALNGRGLAVPADVTDPEALADAVAAGVHRFGSVDVCIANAGIAAATPTTIAHTTVEEFERIIEVDLFGVWRTARACLPHVSAVGGHVLVTSSIYAFINGAANAPYAMSKAAVESFGRSLRAELAGTGATAGVLYPGWVGTPIITAAHQTDSASIQLIDLLIPRPLRTPVTPDAVANAAITGIQRRRARVIVPRRWAPLALNRGLLNAATDTLIDHYPRIHRLLRQL